MGHPESELQLGESDRGNRPQIEQESRFYLLSWLKEAQRIWGGDEPLAIAGGEDSSTPARSARRNPSIL
jgi:hypothetical protein